MSKGFTYYQLDTNKYEDRRIKKLKRSFGCLGLCVYDKIIAEVFRVKGYYLEWDNDTIFDIAEYFGESEEAVSKVVNFCAEIELFDVKMLENGVITSKSIQERYVKISVGMKRKSVTIREDLRLTDTLATEIPEKTPEIPEFSAEIPEEKPRYSMEYNLKENNTKENISLSGDQAERESFEKIFFFKNFIDPKAEVDNFINHYAATDKGDGAWYRANSSTPIHNKEPLARQWKESKQNASQPRRFPDKFIKELSACAWSDQHLLGMIRDMTSLEVDNNSVTIYFKPAARDYITELDKPLADVARIAFKREKVNYRILKQ